MMTKFFCSLVVVGLVGACTQPEGSSEVTTATKNAIALCSAGIEISDSARLELETNIVEALESEGGISAEASIESAVRSAFTEETLRTASGAQAFEGYLDCIKSQLQPYLSAGGLGS